MIYINEYTGQKFVNAAECERSEKEFLEEKKKAEEKARLDKAKREAEKKKREEEEKAKKERVKAAYKEALEATDKATAAIEAYLNLCHREDVVFELDPLIKLFFEI